MKIDKIMIAGMDDQTSIKGLEELKKEFPFVEWGVLFTKNKRGRSRYPTLEYIKELCDSESGIMSAHFCGAYPREILEMGEMMECHNLDLSFDAIQLNYNFKYRARKWDRWNFNELTYIDRNFILQLNHSNKETILSNPYVFERPQFRLLYDASGGRGKEIENIEIPDWNNYTGYAGGINEHNIDRICQMITNHSEDRTVWIDLESGARTDDQFDLEKVKRILTIGKKYITNE